MIFNSKLKAFEKACKKNGLKYECNKKSEYITIKLDDGSEVTFDKDLRIITNTNRK